MSNRSTPLIIISVAILLIGGMYYYAYESKKPKFEWEESGWNRKAYSENYNQPYGTLILHRLLDGFHAGKRMIDIKKDVAAELPSDSTLSGQNYVFVGDAIYLDSLGTKRLLDFVAAGNTALIASKTIPFDLMTFVYFNECEEAPWDDYQSQDDTSAYFSLRTPATPDSSYLYQYTVQNEPKPYGWQYIPSYYFCQELAQYPLGYLNGEMVNFAVFPHGKGRFLLHTNPIAFSNFSLLKTQNRPYLNGVLSHLSEGDIYWDATSRIPEAVGRKRNNRHGYSSPLSDEHPLTYILKQPALAVAWYLLAAMALIWVVFRAKRRQRVIPVLAKNENSSYEFISTIAHLHFRERNYIGLATQSMRHFVAQIREKYGIVAPMETGSRHIRPNDQYFEKLALASTLPEGEARKIFNLYENTVRFEPTEEMAVDLYLAIEAFLRAAK